MKKTSFSLKGKLMKFSMRPALAGLIATGVLASTAFAQTTQSAGFGSGTGMGPGGIVGSIGAAHSIGIDVRGGASGLGTQTFGGGFTRQQSTGGGPLSSSGINSGPGTSGAPVLTPSTSPGTSPGVDTRR